MEKILNISTAIQLCKLFNRFTVSVVYSYVVSYVLVPVIPAFVNTTHLSPLSPTLLPQDLLSLYHTVLILTLKELKRQFNSKFIIYVVKMQVLLKTIPFLKYPPPPV